jgi:diketogulonate reductase-like aldo/keto reductase
MSITIQSRIRLNNGVEIPRLGLGVYQSPPGRITQRVVRYALEIGYRIGNNTIEIWKAMVNLLREGKARAIGVSNFGIDDLKQILNDSDVVPAINQVEFHPFLYKRDLLSFCKKNAIQLEAYSPLTRGRRLSHPTIMNIAKKYDNKTPAQILIRWSLQHNLVVIPKSVHEERILENSQVFDFEFEDEDMKHLDSLNENLQTVLLD